MTHHNTLSFLHPEQTDMWKNMPKEYPNSNNMISRFLRTGFCPVEDTSNEFAQLNKQTEQTTFASRGETHWHLSLTPNKKTRDTLNS